MSSLIIILIDLCCRQSSSDHLAMSSLATGCLKINDTAVEPEILDPLPSSVWLQRRGPDSIHPVLAPPNLTVRHVSPLNSVHVLNLVFFCEQGSREYVTNMEDMGLLCRATLTGVSVTM